MVIWTDRAISHVTDFIDEARTDTEETAKAYMKKLVDYADILENMPQLGKSMKNFTSYETRQIVYKKHRIIYYIKDKDIVIIAVLHIRLDINKALKTLKKDLDK